MSKFTPGPWVVGQLIGDDMPLSAAANKTGKGGSGGRREITSTPHPDHGGRQLVADVLFPGAVDMSVFDRNRDLREANARLIAAAPELLGVLQRILYAHDTGNCGVSNGEAVLCPNYAENARDIINKATWEE